MGRFASGVVLSALACACMAGHAGLVAKWDFNNYDPANPASAGVLKATVGGDARPCRQAGRGTALVTDGTLGRMYVVAPGRAGGDASVADAAAGLGAGNYAIAIPKSSHVALPIPDSMKDHAWTLKIRCWIVGDNVWHTFFNRRNDTDGDLFACMRREGSRAANGVGGGAFGAGDSYKVSMAPGAWHTLVVSAGERRWHVTIDSLAECAAACNAGNRNFFGSPSEPLTVIDGTGHLLLGADDNGEDNLMYVDSVELYDDYQEPELARPPRVSEKMPRFEFGRGGTFTFLMISDWHRRSGRCDTPREMALLRRALERFRPALVVFGGDNVSCDNRRGTFERLMEPAMAELKASGTALCVAFGNHDSEPPESDRAFLTRQEQYDWYKAAMGELFVDHDVPELSGVGTGSVPVFMRGASSPSFKIYVADSGDHPRRDAAGRIVKGSGYDNPRSDQIAWYLRDSADGVPHVWIQHIIVPDANCHGLFVPAGEGEGHKNFLMPDGSKRRMKLAPGVAGVCKEVTCPPQWTVYRDAEHTADSMTLYDAWRRSGCMKGAFFGHDHTNTFDGMDMNGIRLGMTKSFNCGSSYGDREPGFRVFRVRRDGSFESWTETENTLCAVGH
jgi:hypothetical protein